MKNALGLAVMAWCAAAAVAIGCRQARDDEPPVFGSFEEWATASAVPLRTTRPGSGFGNLEVLREIVGDARVVALGESIHMAHEFIEMRHRIIEFLVEEMGFTAVAQETGFSEAELIHRYVLGEVDEPAQWTQDPDEIDAEGYTWGFGKEKEQLALVRWMRSRNLVPGNRRKVNFYGFDVAQGYSSPLTSLQSAWKYLDGVDPGYRDSANRQALISLVDEFLGSGHGVRFESAKRFHGLPQEKKNAFKAEIRRLISYFEMHRVDFIRRSSTIEFEWAYRHAVAARQLNDGTEYLVDVLKSGDWARAQRSRDYCQADNICWILDREGPAGRVIVIAHNSHIQRHEVFQPTWSRDAYPTMGLFLQSRIGDDYVPIGFTFERAVDSFQPYEVDGRFELFQTEADSVGSALSRVGLPLFILNLRTAPKDGAVADWLRQERPMIAETDYIPIRVSTAWDALIFVENISYAHR